MLSNSLIDRGVKLFGKQWGEFLSSESLISKLIEINVHPASIISYCTVTLLSQNKILCVNNEECFLKIIITPLSSFQLCVTVTRFFRKVSSLNKPRWRLELVSSSDQPQLAAKKRNIFYIVCLCLQIKMNSQMFHSSWFRNILLILANLLDLKYSNTISSSPKLKPRPAFAWTNLTSTAYCFHFHEHSNPRTFINTYTIHTHPHPYTHINLFPIFHLTAIWASTLRLSQFRFEHIYTLT